MTSVSIPVASATRAAGAARLAQTRASRGRALDRQHDDDAHRVTACARSSGRCRDIAALSALAISVGATLTSTPTAAPPAGASSARIASSSPPSRRAPYSPRCRRHRASARPVHEVGGRALQHGAADDRRDRDDRRRRGPQRVAHPGTARIGPIEITGFDGPITIARAPEIASSTSADGAASLDPVEGDVVDGPCGALADHELLESVPVAARPHARADRLVAHRQDARADADRAPRAARAPASARARGEHAGARSMHHARSRSPRLNQTSVAELAQAVHHGERVALDSPAARVDAVGEPERDEVGVGGDVRAVDVDVVGRVGDHDEVVADEVEHAARELRAAGAAGQHDDRRRHQTPVEADAGVRLVLDVHGDQQRGHRLRDPRDLEAADVDGAQPVDPLDQLDRRGLRVLAVAADEDVLVQRRAELGQLRGAHGVQGADQVDALGHELGGLLSGRTLRDAEHARRLAAGRRRERDGRVDDELTRLRCSAIDL